MQANAFLQKIVSPDFSCLEICKNGCDEDHKTMFMLNPDGLSPLKISIIEPNFYYFTKKLDVY